MFHYLFTNDLRISHLDSFLKETAICFKNNTVPSANEDKNANNNMNTLGFYFNLTSESNCTKVCAKGDVRKIVLNFIKKFQFPNPRTQSSFKTNVDEGIVFAPMRTIIQTLYIMKMTLPREQAYLTNYEILFYMFFNEKVAKKKNPDLTELIKTIISNRDSSDKNDIPDDPTLASKGLYWNQCKRQMREMVKVLTWSGCVKETKGVITISDDNLSLENKSDIFEILTYTDYWNIPDNDIFAEMRKDYQNYMDINDTDERLNTTEIKYETNLESEFSRNRILFGAPGTGKSFTLNKEKDILLKNGGEYERVTFYPDYSYANFVGTYKPVPFIDQDGKEAITYSYVPGPFMRTYVKAIKSARSDAPKPYLLIIEEINRANVASVFGDIFQLLDRDSKNVSEYPIQTSEDIKNYLSTPENLGGSPQDYSEIRLPDNLFIWATMNSADQGVFPMDTAFKRRWDFTYLGIDESEEGIVGKKVTLGKGDNARVVEWNKLRKAINSELLKYNLNEDKLLGPYFISKKDLPDDDHIDAEQFSIIFKNKVIMYLFDDAAKQKRKSLFSGCKDSATQYSKICNLFDDKGVFIFDDNISSQFIERPGESES
ncbi:AAA family ATPase [Faecalitalea cylindroides]|uniref:AAA family ATPase n=1 Tax=Faecalitalea cylindroides TaxID=39483 RepID=UPI00242A9FE4|nr:AAA family ATPase [Faecalitalea cylindroides]